MTAQQPPTWMSGQSHSAEVLRRATEALIGAGVMTAGAMAVTQKAGTPNLSVDVAGGIAAIPGSVSTYQGTYLADNRGSTNVALATSDGSNPRKDLIVARVRDSVYSGADDDWGIVAVTGTAASSPAEPTAPGNSITLAVVNVAAAATSVVNANITNRRTLARPWATAWGLIGQATITASSPAITTEADVPGLSVSFTAIAGRSYGISALGLIDFTNSDTRCRVMVADGSSLTIDRLWEGYSNATGDRQAVAGTIAHTPTAGAQTYKIRAVKIVGAGSITWAAADTARGHLIVTDLGPA